MTTFHPHRTVWTHDQSARFWDAMSSQSDLRNRYFSAMVGGALIDVVKSYDIGLSGRVLDYGCGVGDLLAALLRRGLRCEGADFSPESVAGVRRRFESEPMFGGATLLDGTKSALAEETYDVVFFVETIEHLLDDDMAAASSELHRIIKLGGAIVVTTPNEDNLAAGEVVCPECGCIFHRMQHVRSWTRSSLEQHMQMSGFDKLRCDTLYLRSTLIGTKAFTAANRLVRRKAPHLLYIGKKSLADQPSAPIDTS